MNDTNPIPLADIPKSFWRSSRIAWILLAVTWIAIIAGLIWCPLLNPTPKEGVIGGMGWVDDVNERTPIQAVIQSFSDTPAYKNFQGDEPKFVYAWKNFELLQGFLPPEKNQGQLGICTGFGGAGAVETTLVNDIVSGIIKDDFKEVSAESLYGFARVEPDIGAGRIRGDGAIGAWIAKALITKGFLWRKKYDEVDLTKYSEARGREWGSRGVPRTLRDEAVEFLVKDVAQVTKWDEAKKAQRSGYGIFICSNQGFSSRRDENGVARPQGTWMHCMYLDGYHTDERGREFGHIQNSWGPNFFSGPVGWGNPNKGGFWADSAVIDRMLKQNDSYAVSGVKGFPAKKLQWKLGKVVPIKAQAQIEVARSNKFAPHQLEGFPLWSIAF
jgi:hypothetical protein